MSSTVTKSPEGGVKYEYGYNKHTDTIMYKHANGLVQLVRIKTQRRQK